MPAILTSQKSNGQQPSARSPRDSAASFEPKSTNGLEDGWADSHVKFETRCRLAELHQMLSGTIDAKGYSWCSSRKSHYVHAVNWEETDHVTSRAVITAEEYPSQNRRLALEQIAFSRKPFVYIATIQGRGTLGSTTHHPCQRPAHFRREARHSRSHVVQS